MTTELKTNKNISKVNEGRADCTHCSTHGQSLFAGIPVDELDHTHIPINSFSFAPHTVMHQAGEKDAALFTIRQGKVKLVQHLANGTTRTVRLLQPGDTLGLEAALKLPHRHSAIAITQVNACRVPIETMHTLIEKYPDLHQQLLGRLQQHLDAADRFITEFSTGSAEARVARLLLFLDRSNQGAYCDLLGREEMASILGITTETASRIMANLKRRKIISGIVNKSFSCDLAQLQLIALDM